MADLSSYLTDEVAGKVPALTGISEAVPPGIYNLQLIESEIALTKSGTGLLLKCIFQILTGEHENSIVYSQFNIKNQNIQSQNIGIGQFKALCLAVNVDFEIARMDTSSLHYKPFRADLGYDKERINLETGQPYPLKNSFRRFIPHNEPAASVKPKPVAPIAAKPAHPVVHATKPLGDAPF